MKLDQVSPQTSDHLLLHECVVAPWLQTPISSDRNVKVPGAKRTDSDCERDERRSPRLWSGTSGLLSARWRKISLKCG